MGRAKGPAKPKPAGPRGRRAAPRVEATWLTPGGYRLAERLVAVTPRRPDGNAIVQIASEVVSTHVSLGRRGLAVCGAAAGAGVTFVTANLAVALAEAGLSTLVVDANLAAPGLHDLIAPPSEGPGLQDLLADEALHSEDVVHADVLPNLSVLYAGGFAGSGPDMLGGERFETLADRWLRDYDCTLVATAPANRSTTALAVAAAMGYALIVARRNQSYAEDVATLTSQLTADEITVIGCVLNRA